MTNLHATNQEEMNDYQRIMHQVDDADHIVITSHKSPDGDSIGSSLALYHFLRAYGKSPVICHPDAAPSFLTWMPGGYDILHFDHSPELVAEKMAAADLIFCLDYNSSNRIGKDMEVHLLSSESIKIMIDHHMDPADFCEIIVSETSVCSTSQLIYELIDQSGNLDLLNEDTGTAIYLGIMTDTGSFRFPSVQPRTHAILEHLLKSGVKHYKVHENVFDTNTLDRLKLRGYAVSEKMEIMHDLPVAIISLTEEELNRFNNQKGDTEGLVNVALSVQGIEMAVFLAEKDGIIKISFRSKGDRFVNVMAGDHFAGGGHKYASGGMSADSMDETIKRFKSVVYNYFN
jgi:phosphoesterase RecJ-like protein